MKLADALKLKALQRSRVVAGAAGLDHDVQWVHVVDTPDPLPWIRAGQLLLTTGYAWPRDPDQQRALITDFAQQQLAGVVLAVPHFFDHMPAAAREAAEAAGLPLIEIPWEIPFAQVTEEVHGAILAEQYRVIERSEIIHRDLTHAALEADSLQDLATALGRLLDRAVTFEDHEGHVLAFYTIGAQEDAIRRTTLQSGQTPPEFGQWLERQGYWDQIRGSREPFRIPAAPEWNFAARVVCPIRIKQELVGLVWIIEGALPLNELDVRAAEHAAIVAALHIAHQRALQSVEARLGYTFLDSLLEGRFDASTQTLERAKLFGFDPEGTYRVGMFVLHVPVPLSRDHFLQRERFAERLRRRLHEIDAPALVSLGHNQIPFVLPEACSVERLWDGLGGATVALAVSRPHRGAAGVQCGYDDVRSMLPHLAPGVLRRYEDLLLPRVLLGDAPAREAFLHELLDPLRATRNGDVLIETLLCWARVGYRLKPAAHMLNVHPKTLTYRLERAAQLGALNLDDPDTRFKLQLAAQLLALTDKIPT